MAFVFVFLLFLSGCFFEKTFQRPAGLRPSCMASSQSSGLARRHCFSASWNVRSLYGQSAPNAKANLSALLRPAVSREAIFAMPAATSTQCRPMYHKAFLDLFLVSRAEAARCCERFEEVE